MKTVKTSSPERDSSGRMIDSCKYRLAQLSSLGDLVSFPLIEHPTASVKIGPAIWRGRKQHEQYFCAALLRLPCLKPLLHRFCP